MNPHITEIKYECSGLISELETKVNKLLLNGWSIKNEFIVLSYDNTTIFMQLMVKYS